ncbi:MULTISPECIES: sensor domain-containing diguanylate cyclase [unclassified Nocardia]|uniref:sensor domain-containing diguanylate cyclase n=1 Tax=unclassified Nocardia TaxID=2637762 RepID=UPI001CE49462|nr:MULTISPECIES: sensor domain-containing diguanylate cyclase [unclassified Nocardia]
MSERAIDTAHVTTERGSGLGVGLRLLRAWWGEGVDYRWVVGAIESRSALGVLKFAIGLCGVVTPIMSVLIAVSPAGPENSVARTTLWLLALAGLVWGLRWWVLPWPGEAESLLLIASADLCVTAVSVLSPGLVVRSVGMVQLLIVGVYVSAFHSPKVLAAHTLWSIATAVTVSVPLLTGGDATSAAIMLLGMAMAVVVPPGLQFCYWVLRSDMLSDPLTQLWNRRGLDYHSAILLGRPGALPICVIMVDLDRFKAVNDTFGHYAGDEVLVRTAARLRGTAPADSVVSRVGGEEFAIVLRAPAAGAVEVADRLRRAVAGPIGSMSVTASIGVARAEVRETGHRYGQQLMRELIRSADSAMYRAKQRGGNAVVADDSVVFRASGVSR